MHTPPDPPVCVLYHPHPLSCHHWHPKLYTDCILLCIIYLFCSYCYHHICSIVWCCFCLLFYCCSLFYFLLFYFAFVCFVINLFCTHILQNPTQHSSDGCNLLLLSTVVEAMSTGASVLTSPSLIQKKPSFILALNCDFTFLATKHSWATKSASKVWSAREWLWECSLLCS